MVKVKSELANAENMPCIMIIKKNPALNQEIKIFFLVNFSMPHREREIITEREIF